MNTVMRKSQRGITLGGMMGIAIALVLVGITAIRVIPAYIEDGKVKHAFTTIANDPEMQKASPAQLRLAFDKIASIDGISVIKGDDIDISSEDGKPSLSASYSIKVPMGGNISILIEFKPTSGK